MKDLSKAVDVLATGFTNAIHEWVNSCLLGALFIAVLISATTLYVVLNEWINLLPIITGAFQQ
jgi:hypothetical protein